MVEKYKQFLAGYVYALIVVIPFGIKYVIAEPLAISYINVFSLIFIFLWILALLFKVSFFKLPSNKLIITGLLIFIVGMFWAFFNTPSLKDGVGLMTSRLFQPLLVGYGVWLLLENKIISVKNILISFLIATLGLAIVTFGQALGIIHSNDTSRVTALYASPNSLARIEAFALLLCLPLIFIKDNKRTVFQILWILGLISLLLTISYNGIATFSLGIITFILINPWFNKKIKYAVLITSVLVGLFLVSNPSRYIPQWETRMITSRDTRLELWFVADKVFQDNPWKGIGIKGWEKNYSSLAQKYLPYSPPLMSESPEPHNLILDALMKGGIPTLVGVLAFMSTLVIVGFRLTKKGSLFGMALLSSAIMLFFFGAIDDPIWSDDIMPYIFIMIALGSYLLNNRYQESLDN